MYGEKPTLETAVGGKKSISLVRTQGKTDVIDIPRSNTP
jgi:hypothetical protein